MLPLKVINLCHGKKDYVEGLKKETIEKVKRREALVKHSVHFTSALLRYHFLITYFPLLGQNIFYILEKPLSYLFLQSGL